MKKYFLYFAPLFILSTAGAQNSEPALVKAGTQYAAAFKKQLLQGNTQRGRKIQREDDSYSFEKAERKTSMAAGAGRIEKADKTEYTAQRPKLKEAAPSTVSSMLKINTALLNVDGPDPMAVAGEKTLLVANTSSLRFFDKATGNLLLATNTTDLFARFLSKTIPGTNTPNPDFASNFYDLPVDIPYWCSKSSPCEDNSVGKDPVTNKNLPCEDKTDDGLIQRAYDVRVMYQKEHRRFVIVAALRNESSKDNNQYNIDGDRDCSQYLIRLIGIAVSRTENPADGFHHYRTGENNYRDWPNAAVDQDYLVLAHKGGSEETDGKSIVTVYNFREMKDGVGPKINGFKIKQNESDGTPRAVIPVANFYMSQAMFFWENVSEGKAKIWYIKKPSTPAAIFNNPPSKLKLAGEVTVNGAAFTGGANAGITYYDNAIYTISFQKLEDATSTRKTGYSLNYFRIPVISKTNNEYETSTKASDGFEHTVFNHADYSYIDPSIAIDAFKNVAINFLLIPRIKNSSEKPQIRYKVKFIQNSAWHASILLKEWAVDEGTELEEKGRMVHYSFIAKDPFKLGIFWQAHRSHTANNSGMFVGKIDLGAF